MEYRAAHVRRSFELSSLARWKSRGFFVPALLPSRSTDAWPHLMMEWIEGDVVSERFGRGDGEIELFEAVLREMADRHRLSIATSDPLLCDIDANCTNMIATGGGVYDIDFDMGRLLRRGVLERPFRRWHRFRDARKKHRAGRVTVYDIVEWL